MNATAKRQQQNDQLESLIAQIELNAEWVSADVDAQCMRAIGLSLDQVTTTEQAFAVLKLQAAEREQLNLQDDTPGGRCFQCDVLTPESSIECRMCHEGITPLQVEREIVLRAMRPSPLLGERMIRRLIQRGVQ